MERCDVAVMLRWVPEIQSTEASDDRASDYRNSMTVSEGWQRDTAFKRQGGEEDEE